METTAEKIFDSLANAGRQVSLDAPFVTGEDQTLLDVMESKGVGADSALITNSLSQEVVRSLGILPERERQVIVLFYGLGNGGPSSLEDIGENFSLTRERVRQIRDKGLMRLRQHSKSQALRSYL